MVGMVRPLNLLEDNVLHVGEGNSERLEEEVEDVAVERIRSALLRATDEGETDVHLNRGNNTIYGKGLCVRLQLCLST